MILKKMQRYCGRTREELDMHLTPLMCLNLSRFTENFIRYIVLSGGAGGR